MYNLIRNENMKIYRRWRTWIMCGILIFIMIVGFLLQFVFSSFSSDQSASWRDMSTQRVAELKTMLAEADKPDSTQPLDAEIRKQYLAELKFEQYRLDENIAPVDRTLWGLVLNSASMIGLVTIFVVIVSADSVAGEFSGGTIKLLLLQPATRAKILLGKYISVFLFALFLIALVILISIIFGAIVFGFDGASLTFLSLGSNGEWIERSVFLQTLITYGLQCVSLLFTATIAFLISTIFRSSAMAISISIGLQFFGQLAMLAFLHYGWAKYILFVHLDLTQYINNTPLIQGVTLSFALMVLLVYYVLMISLTWLLFQRRDVA